MGLRKFFRKRNKIDWKEIHKVGKGTYGTPKIHHWGEDAILEVGAFCSIAENVSIFLGGNHRVDWITTYPFSVFSKSASHIKGHPATKGNVIIGNDVWIGAGATILSGVTIGDGAVIGAQSLVTKDVPPYTIVGGNPATTLKLRFAEAEIRELIILSWWQWPNEKIEAAIPHLLSGDINALLAFSISFDETNQSCKP